MESAEEDVPFKHLLMWAGFIDVYMVRPPPHEAATHPSSIRAVLEDR